MHRVRATQAIRFQLVDKPHMDIKKKTTRSWAHNNKKKHFVDLKLGNLMVQRVTRCETRQGMEICSIISAYLSAFVEQHHQSSANDPVPTLLT